LPYIFLNFKRQLTKVLKVTALRIPAFGMFALNKTGFKKFFNLSQSEMKGSSTLGFPWYIFLKKDWLGCL
jgi:hypothetical protein